MWFLHALAATLSWGGADLFYKKGTDEKDRYSHLRIAVWVGLVMGVCAFALLPLAESGYAVLSIKKLIQYSPASLFYIISMVIGYAGMRYLELSIISPVQNASGALSAVVMVIFFVATGAFSSITDEFTWLDLSGTALIVIGIIALAIAEKTTAPTHSKYRLGVRALIFPLLYCLFDTLGTAADGIILDEESGMDLGEFDVIILYGLTFFMAGIVAWIYLLCKEKRPYNPLREPIKGVAAGFEMCGQFFYVFAMAQKPVLAAPMIASYCIVSVILSRIFLKEKLPLSQALCVFTVIVGIVALGIAEGLAEG